MLTQTVFLKYLHVRMAIMEIKKASRLEQAACDPGNCQKSNR
jgi:hypothetical protein